MESLDPELLELIQTRLSLHDQLALSRVSTRQHRYTLPETRRVLSIIQLQAPAVATIKQFMWIQCTNYTSIFITNNKVLGYSGYEFEYSNSLYIDNHIIKRARKLIYYSRSNTTTIVLCSDNYYYHSIHSYYNNLHADQIEIIKSHIEKLNI